MDSRWTGGEMKTARSSNTARYRAPSATNGSFRHSERFSVRPHRCESEEPISSLNAGASWPPSVASVRRYRRPVPLTFRLGGGTAIAGASHEQRQRFFDQFGERAEELCASRAVERSVVAGQRQHHGRLDGGLA